MDPIQRLKEATQVFRQGGHEENGWFDKNQGECREGERLLKEGREAEAERIFRKASEEAKTSWGQKKHRPRILLALATAEWRQGKREEARRSGEEALALLGGEKGRGLWEYGELCELLGRVAWEADEQEAALERMSEAVAGGKALREMNGSRLVERQRWIGRILQASGREEEAEQAWDAALELAEARCGSESAAAADCLMDLCGAAARRHDMAEAKELGEDAVRLRRLVCGNDSMEVAKDLEMLAGHCQAGRDFEAAVKYLEQALQVRDRQIGGNTPELATLLMALADVYTLLGRIAPALELMRQAVGKLGPRRDRNLAVALEKLGGMYVKTGRYEDAGDCYSRARQYWGEDAEANVEELLANSRALEELAALLPAGGAQKEVEARADDDPGISVLLPELAAKASAPLNVAPATVEGPAIASPARPAYGVAAAPGATGEPAVLSAPAAPAGTGDAARTAPAEWTRAQAGSGMGTSAGAVAASGPAVETEWNGWEEVEFELLLTDGEGRGR